MTWRSNLRAWVVISIVLMAFASPSAAKVIYVDADAPGANDGTSWEDAYNYLQDALADANSDDEIWVADGIYKPDEDSAHPSGTGDRTATFQLKNGLAIYGGFKGYINIEPPPLPPPPMSLDTIRTTAKDSNRTSQPEIVVATNISTNESGPSARDVVLYETILSGDLNGDDGPDFANIADNSIHVVNGSSTEPNAVLDGLTISDGYGSGMYNYGGSPAVANCTFSDNFANEGGGMLNTHFSDPVVTNCKFSLNQAGENGGAMCNENSNPVVTGCTFVANSIMRFSFGFGGAVYNEGCSPTFKYCIFINNSAEAGGGGMYNRDSSPTLTNCTFEGNWSGLFGGGLDTVSESSNPIVIGCTFIGNSAENSGGGTSNGTSSLTLINCIFVDNSALDAGGGMYSVSGRNIDVINCTFYGNEATSGNTLACRSESTVQLTNCILWDGGNEIWNPRGSLITITYSDVCGGQMSVYDPCEALIWGKGNIDVDPCFVDVNNGDYHLRADSLCINAGDPNYVAGPNETDLDGKPRIIEGRIDMGAYEYQELTILYVDANSPGPTYDGSSWTNAYKYLQDALADAYSATKPVKIQVAQGIYKPDRSSTNPSGTGDRTATFQLINGITLRGGYAGFGEPNPNARDIELYQTILSGDLDGNDVEVNDPCDLLNEPTRAENSYNVIVSSNANETTVLNGLTITGSNANNFEGGYFMGGGMCNGGGNPTVTNCKFKLNSAIEWGGGMLNWKSSPTLSYCTFSENSAHHGGGLRNEESNPILINCIFTKNYATGQYAMGGGIYNGECSKPTIVNCIFTGNFAGFGGGGICNVSYSRATLTSCTFADNSAVTYGGAIYWEYGPVPPPVCSVTRGLIITNCILLGNSDSSGLGESAQIYSVLTPTANYNCIQGLTGALGGTGNIDADPLFVDADGADNITGTEDDNLRLLPGSPCIDAGDNSALPPSVVTDLDGEPRIANGTVDMGAYEGPDQGILLSAESVVVAEGQTATFTVALAMDPCGTLDVNVAHYSGDTDITVQSGEHLIFDSSNYSQPKTVTLAANEDSDNINGQALFRLSGSGLPTSGVTATEQDNDTILYVDTRAVAGGNNGSNWANAFTDLQDALITASIYTAVNEIRVAQGVYTPAGPGGDRIARFQLINGVALKGGYAGFGEPDPNERDIELYESILSGDLDGNDVDVNNPEDLLNEPTRAENSYTIIIADSTNSTSVLDGFTITGANSKDRGGGGMINYNSNPTVTNCTFTGNLGSYGAAMFNLEAKPRLNNCVFMENASDWSGAGIENCDSNTILINCRFSSNWTHFGGSGLYNWNSNPTLANCTFVGNSSEILGGGMWNNFQSNPTLTNCMLINNSAWEGGGIFNGSDSIPVLTNCILWGNTNGQIEGGAIALYSDVQGGWAGLGNINVDPCFADANNGDYHLKSQAGRWDANSESWVQDDVTSPCIDAGNPGCPVGDEPAPNSNRRNMGAYGGTIEASKSPAYWRSIADMTNDWIVNSNDLKVFADYWLQTGECLPGDFDRSQFVDFNDFAIFGGQWQEEGPGPATSY